MVSIRGKVIEQITGDEARKHVDKLAKKYLGLDEYPGPEQRRVILKIKPEKVFHKNYSGKNGTSSVSRDFDSRSWEYGTIVIYDAKMNTLEVYGNYTGS